MKKNLLYLFAFLISALNSYSQDKPIILVNATIHIGNGNVIEKGVLVFEKGKVVQVGKQLETFYKNGVSIDMTGKHIYPALIALNNIMGLNEIDAIRATRDYYETGNINPNLRSSIAYNTDSKILPTATFNGILYTQAVPQGGTISGTSSLLKVQAWNWEDALVKEDEGIHVNWPQMSASPFSHENAEKQIERTERKILEIETFFEEAYQYHQQNNKPFNARLAAMKQIFDGKQNLYIHAQEAKEIIASINFFKTHFPSIKLVLVGAAEAYQVIDFLKQQNIPVVLGNIHALPGTRAEDVDQPFKTPAQLAEAGITVALSREGSWETRNLPFLAGTAAAYGMNKEQALKAITLTPAEILGVADRIGSLEKGKDASLVVSDGDLLDMKSCVLRNAWIEGEEVELNNQQQQLAEKYKKKYGLK